MTYIYTYYEMITTISLVNIHHLIKIQKKRERKKYFFLVMRILRIYSQQLSHISCVRAKSLQFCVTLCSPMDCSPQGSSVHRGSPGENTGVGCHALDLPNPGIEPISLMSPALAGGFFTSTIWEAFHISHSVKYSHVVHHISGTYLSYNWKLVAFDHLHSILPSPTFFHFCILSMFTLSTHLIQPQTWWYYFLIYF